MHTGNPIAHKLTAISFVGVLAAVGIASHFGSEVNPVGDVLSGSYQSKYEDGFKAANPLSGIAINAFASVRYAVLGQASNGAIVGDDGWIFSAEELETHNNFDANIKASVQEVAFAKATLEAKGIHLLAVIVPDKADVYAEQLSLERSPAIKARRATFVSLLQQAGVETYDTAPTLISLKSQTDAFMKDDTHWSPSATQGIAAMIANKLSKVERDAVAVTTTETGSTPFDGDLLAFVPTGPFRPYVGPTQNTISTYETAVETTGGLFGDPVIDFVLVGTSYSAKADWHFEGFLKQTLQADVLNVSLEGQGPFVPMNAFLNSETLENTPPKVVIWEIPVRYISKDMN